MRPKFFLIPPNRPSPDTHIEFDFVVATRPRYTAGSGPPLAPVSIMPPDGEDYIITGEVEVFSALRYLVEHRQDFNFRVAVRFPKILDWVSPRELDDYHRKKYDAEVLEEEQSKLPLLEAKEHRQKKKAEKQALLDLPVKAKSRKRKRANFSQIPAKPRKANQYGREAKKSPRRPRGPGNRNQQLEEKELTFTSPKQSEYSQRQPSLSGLGGLANRTILDISSDDEDTEQTPEYQLNGAMIPQSNMEASRSNSPPTNSRKSVTSNPVSKHVNASLEKSRSLSVPILPPIRPQKTSSASSSDRAGVAAISSRQAFRELEELERESGRNPLSIVEKYSHKKNDIQAGVFRGAHAHLPPSSRRVVQEDAEEETDELVEEDQVDEEYEVRRILNHETRTKEDGTPDIWYRIQWVGDWDDTWEPKENIGSGAIEEYEAKLKRLKQRIQSSAPVDGNDSDPDSLFVSNKTGQGRGKEVRPGQIIDDEDDEDDLGDSNWQELGIST